MKVIAPIANSMPTMIFVVNASLKTIVPTRIAVIGSNTPNTDALVAPMLRVAMASVAVDTIVGKMANAIRFAHAFTPSKPVVIPVSDNKILPKNTTAPVDRA